MATGITMTSDQSNKYMIVAGTIRDSGSGWQVVDDSGHEPSFLTVGTVSSSYVQVLYPTALQVVSFQCGPDDTFARPPYSATFGASVGLSYAYIKGTVSGADFNPSTWSHSSANIWIRGEFLVG